MVADGGPPQVGRELLYDAHTPFTDPLLYRDVHDRDANRLPDTVVTLSMEAKLEATVGMMVPVRREAWAAERTPPVVRSDVSKVMRMGVRELVVPRGVRG
jgi:hypothetical protein